MVRGTWIFCEKSNKIIPKHECTPHNYKRSELSFPMIISDNIELQSMLDGKIYTSKSELRKTYKQNGFIEVGGDPSISKPRPRFAPNKKEISDAVEQAVAKIDRN